jgi:CRISPR/Cas system type I-B associated protein Csh2 (Cas7 group RAMP superfamily)
MKKVTFVDIDGFRITKSFASKQEAIEWAKPRCIQVLSVRDFGQTMQINTHGMTAKTVEEGR